MPASKSSPSGDSHRTGKAGARSAEGDAAGGTSSGDTAIDRSSGEATSDRSSGEATSDRSSGEATSDRSSGLTNLIEQLVSHVINPLGLVVLTRERIQDTLEEAAARGRVTRSDATEIAAELVRRGRLETEELLADAERLIGRGRGQFDSAVVRSRFSDGMERIVRTADRARRSVGVGPSLPILGYDDLTAAQVTARLKGLSPTELRRVREYERRHANRKSVLDAIERALR
jgi:polyhydroxyalkanoate synthesis regulator phasin